MRLYVRTSRHTGISMGLLGWMLAFPFVMLYFVMVGLFYLVVALVWLVSLLVTWLAGRAQARRLSHQGR